jgi:tight adherence protein C
MDTSLAIIVEVLIFGIVVLIAVAVAREVERQIDQRRRLGAQSAGTIILASPLLAKGPEENSFFRWVRASTSISDTQERDKLRKSLFMAGFSSPDAVVWYVIVRFGLAIGLPGIFLLLQTFSAKPVSGFALIFWPLILCAVGLLAPSRILANRATARQTQLEYEFPDALDLMVVCVEAGLSLDAAFVRVGREIAETHPRIAEEFERVAEQLRAGRARPDALRAMADRTGTGSVRSFVALLIQTEALGSGIAHTLRIFSTEMRQSRFLKAEEKAMRIPVVMTVPLVACILPVIVAASLLPAMIDVIRVVLPALKIH